ncbi:hypothetical protein NIES4103_42840 [Nostoc sp. NIES-4103]|nr:hypothetical protein NIES4103_42840 [Nostoc sp. NIES-4103]
MESQILYLFPKLCGNPIRFVKNSFEFNEISSEARSSLRDFHSKKYCIAPTGRGGKKTEKEEFYNHLSSQD